MNTTPYTKIIASALVVAIILTGCAWAGVLNSPKPKLEGERMSFDPIEKREMIMEGVQPLAVNETNVPDSAAMVNVTIDDLYRDPSGGRSRATKISGEVRGMWISFLELGPMMNGKSEAEFTRAIRTMYDNCLDYGINTLYVHVRPFGDAFYPSEYFPWSYLCTGTEGRSPGYDPLEIMVREARSRGLRFEAWINPYRVRAQGNNNALHSTNHARRWIEQNDDAAIRHDGIISFNPASAKARALIINGVREIMRNYRVDGIHIDDYFYPTTAEAFDRASYKRYRDGGGALTLANWRRANVERLLRDMYTAIKEENPDVTFGISPQSSLENNYNQQYLDVAKIVSTTGYCDYIMPQIYFGFNNAVQPYAKTMDTWDRLIKNSKIELHIGIAAYKAGVTDTWAKEGSREWVQNRDILKRQVEYSRNAKHYKGFAIFRYDSIFNPSSNVRAHAQAEAANLKAILK